MQLPIVTGLYAGLLGIFLCVLTAQVGILRGKLGISLDRFLAYLKLQAQTLGS